MKSSYVYGYFMYKEKLPILLTLLFVSIKNRDVLEMIKCHRHLLSVFACLSVLFTRPTNLLLTLETIQDFILLCTIQF